MGRNTPVLILLLLAASGAAACGAPGKEDLVQRGDALYADGKWAEAQAEYQKALEIDQAYGEAHARLADVLEQINPGDVASIRRERLRAAQLLPQNNDIQYRTGQMLVETRRWDEVDLRADLIFKNAPHSWQARLLKAEMASGRKDPAGALALLEEAIAIAPNEADLYVSLGRLHQSQQRPIDAEAALRRAAELGPQRPATQAALGDFYWSAGRSVDAERALKKATELDPGDARSQRTLANLYQAAGRLAEAEAPLKAWAERRRDVPARLALADYYIRANRLDEAQNALSGSAAGESRTELDLRLAEVLFRKNQKSEAHRQVDAVLAQDATNADALVVKARLLRLEGRLDDALARATQATRADAESADAYFVLGEVQQDRRDIAAAIEAFTRVTVLTRQSQPAQNALVDLRLQQGSAEALEQVTAMVGRSRTGPGPALTLSRALLQRGDLRRAESVLTGLLREHGDSAPVHAQLGRLRTLQNRPAEARVEFDRALALNPRSTEAFRGRVEIELRAKNMAAARAMVDERLETIVSVQDLLLAARVHEATGDPAQSEAALRRVLELNPDHDTAMRALVRSFTRQGTLDQRRLEYEASARSQPASIVAPIMAALIFEEQDKRADAQRTLEAVLAKAPTAPVAMASLARLYSTGAKDTLGKALDLAQRARLVLPDSPELAATLGWIHYRQGNAALAIPPFEAAAADLPNNSQLRYRLGLAYALAGDSARALDAFEQALRIRPGYPQAVEARADLRRGVTPTPAARGRGAAR